MVAAAAVVLVAAGAAAVYEWRAGKGHIPDPQAYQLYLQGRRDIQEFTEHGFKQSVVDFKNAIARDPEYAAAYAGLADACSDPATFEMEQPKDVLPLAESNAAKAIEQDSGTAAAYTVFRNRGAGVLLGFSARRTALPASDQTQSAVTLSRSASWVATTSSSESGRKR